MVFFACPYLGGPVELTRERERHVRNRHPELLPGCFDQFVLTVADPDEVRLDELRDTTRSFSRWFPELKGGKFITVAVVSDRSPAERHWIRTAYVTRRLVRRKVEWKRDSR